MYIAQARVGKIEKKNRNRVRSAGVEVTLHIAIIQHSTAARSGAARPRVDVSARDRAGTHTSASGVEQHVVSSEKATTQQRAIVMGRYIYTGQAQPRPKGGDGERELEREGSNGLAQVWGDVMKLYVPPYSGSSGWLP